MAELVYTIGHSTHTTEKLIQLLAGHDVTAVADVRSQPYSRINPQFNRESLRAELKTAGVEYVFLGRELGARSEDRSCYLDGQVQFDLLARTALFQEGLTRIIQGAGSHRIALLCAEKDPLMCHRTILVCRHLTTCGITAQHILENGRLESHEEAITRLLAELDIPERDLFRTRDDLIIEAYSRRGRQIAYSEKQPAIEESAGGVQRRRYTRSASPIGEKQATISRMFIPRPTCYACRRPESLCLCPTEAPLSTRTRIVLLTHPKEHRREKCTTGRLTCFNLANSEIIPGLAFDGNGRVRTLIDDPENQPVLLYPGEGALDLSSGSPPAPLAGKRKLVVFLIDATWACSRKMLRQSPGLLVLPRIMFTPRQRSRFIIKHQPREWCLSTLEATHELLLALEAAGLDEYPDKGRLLKVFDSMQDFQIECELKHRRLRFAR